MDESSLDLPPATLTNLPKILELFTQPITIMRKERLSLSFLKDNYIDKLFELFHMCEDLENIENLHIIFHIFKAIGILKIDRRFLNLFSIVE